MCDYEIGKNLLLDELNGFIKIWIQTRAQMIITYVTQFGQFQNCIFSPDSIQIHQLINTQRFRSL